MSGTYLTWLAGEFRAAGLRVVEYDGWTTRARSSGGFSSGRPLGVWWHHTASSTSPGNDASYMCHGSDSRPVANVLIARDGEVWVLAAGATNTNGKGYAQHMSRGTVPQDSANTHVLGVEIANNGVGEPYPQAQVDAAFVVSNVVNRKMGNQPTDVCTHQHYAPDRKIDPAGPVHGPWQPASCTSSGTWSTPSVANECAHRATTPQEDGDVNTAATIWTWGTRVDTFVRGDDGQCYHQWWTEKDNWTPWECMGGVLAGSPWAVFKDDRVDVWARGTDNTIWQNTYLGDSHAGSTGKWTGWFATSEWPGR